MAMTLTARLVMVLGTASGSGKSTIAMALCRMFSEQGFRVSPFKAINISLNSIVTRDGSEIARAQWLQALAAGIMPEGRMNPYLIKYEGRCKGQLIENGKSLGSMTYKQISGHLDLHGKEQIRSAIDYLSRHFDVIVIEGSGSPAEINRESEDYANTFILNEYFPEAIIASDIEFGGVFAALYGTYLLTENNDSIKWFVINRMRGDPSVLRKGSDILENLTNMKLLGVIPRIENILLPGEDGNDYAKSRYFGSDVCIIRYPMMENLSEVDPLPVFGINYFYLDRADDSLIKSARLIILPGSKDVPEDLKFLKESGIEKLIQERAKIGVKILGICGGYQILGKEISLKDTRRKEEIALEGLGLLETKFAYSTEKKLENLIFGLTSEIKDKSTKTEGYEIHYGDVVENSDTPLFETGRGKEGSMNRSGNIFGTNIHGCLENTDFLNFIMGTDIQKSYAKELDREIKRISTIIIESMEISKLNLKAS